ncbi:MULTISPECIES: ATP-binding cassette domain-containing protein [unclassified Acidovorax]|uniref:ATP-binding cassette domain-containing protein n=1 Tax=unclassified Acidovorax TaxID=2684926 RepID=UPI0028831E99|nr:MULTISPECIES: ATP-binding cassette domain-containing protein [unclassified Acidovorax]
MKPHDDAINSIATSAYPSSAKGQFDSESADIPLLRVTDLARHYALPRERLLGPRSQVAALAGVSFTVEAGRSLGVVGESGSGKSTLARLVMALDVPSAGTVEWQGRDLHRLPAAELRAARAGFQMVFQDPYGSLDPRQTVARIVAEPLDALPPPGRSTPMPRAEQRERVLQALAEVGLRSDDAAKYPHEFSGGQRQRIAIARALVTRPRLIVADEPVSALDVSVQAQVLNLLQDLREQHGIAYLLISHDLAVVNHVCDEVVVLHQGRIVERGAPAELFSQPRHPYTQALVAAVPRIAPGASRARRTSAAPGQHGV